MLLTTVRSHFIVLVLLLSTLVLSVSSICMELQTIIIRISCTVSAIHLFMVQLSVDGERITKDVTSVKLACKVAQIYGLLNEEGRPWTWLLTAYNLFVIIWAFFGSRTVAVMFSVANSGNLLDMFQGISFLCGLFHVIGKVINVLLKEKKIKKLLQRLETVRLETMKNEEAKIFVQKSDKFLINFIMFYNIGFLSYPFVSAVINFFNDYRTDFKKPHLSVPMWTPWSMNELWKYLGGSISATLVLITAIGYYGSVTSLQFTFAFQISGFVKALRHQLETQGSNNKSVYQRHITIIQLINEFNSIFCVQMYLEILVSPVQPCGFGYALIKALNRNDPSAGSLVFITLLAMSTSFTVCYCGQEVSTQMEKLHISAYMNQWYELKPKVRRDLLQMMLITRNPTVFTYRRWAHFDYVTFAAVMQGVYTYLSMMAHFVDG